MENSLTPPQVPESELANRRLIAWACGLMIVASLAISGARLMHAVPLQSANDRSRWATVWSLVERGTYQIDEIRRKPGWDTIDLVRHEGHFYSSKPPFLATLVAGLYWGVRESTGLTLLSDTAAVARIILLLVNVLPLGVALGLLTQLMLTRYRVPFAALFVVASACFATLLLPFAMALNNHLPAAVGVMIAVYCLIEIRSGRDAWWLYAGTGFFAAFACCNELPAALFGLATFFLLVRHNWRWTLLIYAPAALIPLVGFFVTNWIATGGWKPFYMYYGTEKYEFVHEGVPSYWIEPRGLDRNRDCGWLYLFHCTLGHHGILSLTPIYLITALGWFVSIREAIRHRRLAGLDAVHVLGCVLTLVVLGFFLSRTENYNYGGVSVALRWMLWLVPFWLLAMLPGLEIWRPQRIGRVICIALFAASVFSAWYPLNGPWKHPWLFTVMESAGLIDYSDPAPPPFERRHSSWISQLPAGSEADAEYWIEFQRSDSLGRIVRLRLEDAGPAVINDRPVRRLRITQTVSQFAESPEPDESVAGLNFQQVLAIDVAKFEAGAPVTELPVWESEPPERERRRWVLFLHGMPGTRVYIAGKFRYEKFPIRRDAFHCRLAATQVDARAPRFAERDEQIGAFRYRRDLWLSDEVPFGVLQFRDRVIAHRSGQLEQEQRMTVSRVGKLLSEQGEQ